MSNISDLTPEKLKHLMIFNHLDKKLPPHQSPECRLLHIDDELEGKKADELTAEIETLVKEGVITYTSIDLTHLLIRMEGPATERFRILVAQLLENT